MGTTETLARWIADTSYEQIPVAAIAQAKKSILDYIGTATYGSTSELGKIILEFTREQGGNQQARVIGTDIRYKIYRISRPDSFFINLNGFQFTII